MNNSQETGVLLLCIFRDQSVNKIGMTLGDFPGGPVVKIPHSQCRGPGFDPWSGSWEFACCN